MPKVSPEHMEARRNQILDAATTCFAQHGIRESTIQRICTEAGLSAGALYRYFHSKEEILEAVYARSMVANRSFGDQLAGSDDPLDTLRGLVAGMVGFIADPALTQEHHLSIRVHAEGLSNPAVAESYTALHRAVVTQLTPLLQALQAQGRVPADLDAEYFVWVLLTAYQGLRVHSMLDPNIDLDRYAAALLTVVDGALQLEDRVGS